MVSGRFWTSVVEFGSPFCRGPGTCSMEGWWGTLLLPVFCWPTTPENENLALAVHVSISIPASLQVIACLGSFWCNMLVPFELLPSPFCVEWGLSLLQTWEVYLAIATKCFSLGCVLGGGWGPSCTISVWTHVCMHFGCSLPKENNVSKLMLG